MAAAASYFCSKYVSTTSVSLTSSVSVSQIVVATIADSVWGAMDWTTNYGTSEDTYSMGVTTVDGCATVNGMNPASPVANYNSSSIIYSA